ncbi:MAG: HNH endonuclease [Alphaproteobacteria bacterium]|nr:HNH endonuclease [Alphaproteobacteria bacterium]
MKADALTYRRANELLHYDPESGIFRWRMNGREAGCVDRSNGYRRINCDGRLYYAHRVAWLMMTESWPVELVDHIDRNRLNCAWANLRAATRFQNNKNMSRPSTNRSGHKGVHFCRCTGRWRAEIIADGKKHRLGRFDTIEAAAAAYDRAALCLHGEFAARTS